MTESPESELARLRAELAGVRDELAQRDRALVAAHRAIEIAQMDHEKLRWALDGTTRMMAERSDNNSRGMRWMRDIVAANQEVLTTDHPGAALLSELDAARALADSVTAFFNKRGWSHAIMIGNDDILAMSEALSNYGAVEQRKARKT